jgi:uncharacterized protein (TIGR03067 family)
MRVLSRVLLGCAVAVGIAAASDFETVQGNWKLVAAVRDGKPLTGADLGTKLSIQGDRFSFAEGSTIASAGTFKLGEAASPKTIDITYDAGPNQGQSALGIYEVRAGNRHRLCIAPPGAPRPAKFESRPGSGVVFQEWEKIK